MNTCPHTTCGARLDISDGLPRMAYSCGGHAYLHPVAAITPARESPRIGKCCQRCGAPFEARNQRQLYCGTDCKLAARVEQAGRYRDTHRKPGGAARLAAAKATLQKRRYVRSDYHGYIFAAPREVWPARVAR